MQHLVYMRTWFIYENIVRVDNLTPTVINCIKFLYPLRLCTILREPDWGTTLSNPWAVLH